MDEYKQKIFDAKCIAYTQKDARTAFQFKTPYSELPIMFTYGSSSCHPDNNRSLRTADLVLWVKFINTEWFRPCGGFTESQIAKMLEICMNDLQIDSLINMLCNTN